MAHISRKMLLSAVEAARTCKQCGVRMVASAHGCLRKLAKNTELKGLLGHRGVL